MGWNFAETALLFPAVVNERFEDTKNNSELTLPPSSLLLFCHFYSFIALFICQPLSPIKVRWKIGWCHQAAQILKPTTIISFKTRSSEAVEDVKNVTRICIVVRTFAYNGIRHRETSYIFQRCLILLILFLVDMLTLKQLLEVINQSPLFHEFELSGVKLQEPFGLLGRLYPWVN